MTTKEAGKKGIKGIKTIIYGRTLFVMSAFLVQFALFAVMFLWLREYSFYVYGFFVIVSIVVVLHLFRLWRDTGFKAGMDAAPCSSAGIRRIDLCICLSSAQYDSSA